VTPLTRDLPTVYESTEAKVWYDEQFYPFLVRQPPFALVHDTGNSYSLSHRGLESFAHYTCVPVGAMVDQSSVGCLGHLGLILKMYLVLSIRRFVKFIGRPSRGIQR